MRDLSRYRCSFNARWRGTFIMDSPTTRRYWCLGYHLIAYSMKFVVIVTQKVTFLDQTTFLGIIKAQKSPCTFGLRACHCQRCEKKPKSWETRTMLAVAQSSSRVSNRPIIIQLCGCAKFWFHRITFFYRAPKFPLH